MMRMRNAIVAGAIALWITSADAQAPHKSDWRKDPAGGGAVRAEAKAWDKDKEPKQTRTSRSVQPMMMVTVPPLASVAKSLGGYTRLVADFAVDPTDWVRNYDEERRSFLARLFAGKTIGRLVTVKATLARPRVSTITTFASFDYASSRKAGESWASEVDPARVLTPFFRIDADSAITLEATATATSAYQMNAAAGLLDIVKRAAKLVAPTTTLVTSLNKERFEDASSFVDQSLSSLMQESLTEKSTNDFPMKDWVGRDLLTIEIWLPIANEVTPNRNHVKAWEAPLHLGTWTIRATPAILSVFSDTPLLWTDGRAQEVSTTTQRGKAAPRTQQERPKTQSQCSDNDRDIRAACEAFRTLDPQTVLNFQVDSGVALAQALAGDAGIAAAREHLLQSASAQDSSANENANALCTLVADKAHVLGFNRFDVAAILWAYSSQSFVTKDAGDRLRDENNCSPLKIAYSVGLPHGGFAAAETVVKVQAVPAAPAPAPAASPPT